MHRLFDEFAHRYDLHTSPDHYRHDHEFVLDLVQQWNGARPLLDVGCGTGVLIEKARRLGLPATGLDASPGMVREAERRLGPDAVALKRMQDLGDDRAYQAIVSLSWTVNYCQGRDELQDVLRRFHRALKPGGGVVLQVAHAANAPKGVLEDREAGPAGEPGDVIFLYHFRQVAGESDTLAAEYVYACKSAGELLHEEHLLHVADARMVAALMQQIGFVGVELYDSYRRDAFEHSVSPFVIGRRASGSSPA